MKELNVLMDSLVRPNILVIGDVILDQYSWGEAERISPEAPVMVFRSDRDEVRLGGAGSVAVLLRRLEAEVTLTGLIGDDGSSRVVEKLLQDEGIHCDGVLRDPGRLTTSKTRFMGRAGNRHAQQVLRVDREDRDALSDEIEKQLISAILELMPGHAAVLISDYAKGVCTPKLLAEIIREGAVQGVPVLIDPARIADYTRYRNATLLAPNRVEAEMATGIRIGFVEKAQAAAYALSVQLDVQTVLIKLDSEGMYLFDRSFLSSRIHDVQCGVLDKSGGQMFPTRPREVYDVTGAGDMVLAMMGLSLASGFSRAQGVELANLAAGLEVEKLGVAPVTRTEIQIELARTRAAVTPKVVTCEEMVALGQAYRKLGKTLVFTNGCFDLLHVGHATYLQEAAKLGDILMVAVNSDDSVRRLKGPGRPVIKQADRAAMIAALECVDHVFLFDQDTPLEPLRKLRPHVLVKGGTYSPEQVVGKEVVESYGGKVCLTECVRGISTSAILTGSVRS
jgi:D-beta-D-heptose 7-phosphate kinase/D-beta-D-heptose 1-phosphate adenosyltransferase